MKFSYVLPDPASYAGWEEFDGDLACMKQAGYHAVELQIADPADLDENRLRRSLEGVGYRLCAFQTGGTYATRGNCLCTGDEAVRRRTIDLLKSRDVWVFGVEQERGQDIFAAKPFKEPIALLLGEEGAGIRRLPKEKCDGFYKIPMFGYINSLNLSVAAAILMYQVRRFRDY